MKILITGATGIIGQKLIKKIQSTTDDQISSLITKEDKSNNTKTFIGDVRDIESLKIATSGIDIVIHLAAITHTNNKNEYYKINTKGTENLLKASFEAGVKKFIFISTRTASREGGSYAESKLLAEDAVRKYKNNWTIISLGEVYGAGSKEVTSKIIELIQKSPIVPVIGTSKSSLSPVFIDDVVNAMVNAIENEKTNQKKYILCGNEEMSFLQLINRLLKILGKKRIKIYIPMFLLKLVSFFLPNILVRDQIPRFLCEKPCDIYLAKKDLGFNPRSLEEGIREMLK